MASGLNPVLAYAAGALTILSPCVLPLVPIVLGSAAQQHRWGPLALCAGLVVSFTAVGFAVATPGVSVGLDSEVVRKVGAVLLILVGAALLLPPVQHAVERLALPSPAGRARSRPGWSASGWPARRASACCWGWCGAPAWARRWARRPCWRRRAVISARSRR